VGSNGVNTISSERGGTLRPLPQPLPDLPPIPEPADTPYPGILILRVDARDIRRGIFQVRQTIPVVGGGELLLVYPRWLPGFHAPQAPIELFAGLEITAAGRPLTWIRHPVEVNAFHVDVPEGVAAIELTFQFLSPTSSSQGRVLCSEAMLFLPWNTVLVHPAGYYARQTIVEPSLTVPDGWSLSCVLEVLVQEGSTYRFAPVALDTLVDSPVLAGRHLRRIALDESVCLTLAGEEAAQVEATPEQIAPHRALVEQADRLFGTRAFDRFEMLLGLSDTLSPAGIEHHRSFEGVTVPGYFTNWNGALPHRDTVAHEFVHSWNGKGHRGADSWQPCFQKPIRSSLMWVYEGLTQYWTNVLCARSSLWSPERTREALALSAARYDVRPGSKWRPLIDTTRDPIIAARAPLPWSSWQRSEDYYSEGALIWLDVDTRLRALSGDTRSLDDFARGFFARPDGDWTTHTYRFEDVITALEAVAPFDWTGFFREALMVTQAHVPLAGLERGGYRLVYRDAPSEFSRLTDVGSDQIDLTHTLGLTLTAQGAVRDVLWDGPAFAAGLTVGATVTAVAGRRFSSEALYRAVEQVGEGSPIEFFVVKEQLARTVAVQCPRGARYPHLERIPEARARLDEILGPRLS
jgi:predicted metalloprotease with PDZ domain